MTHTPSEGQPTAAEVAAERWPEVDCRYDDTAHREGRPHLPIEGEIVPEAAPLGNCAWFLMCLNDAVRLRTHPILGPTPVCARCDERAERSGIREA